MSIEKIKNSKAFKFIKKNASTFTYLPALLFSVVIIYSLLTDLDRLTIKLSEFSNEVVEGRATIVTLKETIKQQSVTGSSKSTTAP